MALRSLVAIVSYALGMIAVLSAISYQLSHAVYGDFIAPGATVKLGAAGLVLLTVAHLAGRSWQVPLRLIVFCFVAFGGMRLAIIPVKRREFSGWAATDYILFLVGLALFGGALLWAHSYRRAKQSKSPAV